MVTKKSMRRMFAYLLSALMVLSAMSFGMPEITVSAAQTNQFVLEASTLTAFAAGEKSDGTEEVAGTDDYFTIIYSAKSKVDGSNKSFEDGYESGQRINLGGKVSLEKNAVKFTTSSPASVKIWWVEGGEDNRQMTILNASGEVVVKTDETHAKNEPALSSLELAEAGTYYLGGDIGNNYIFKLEVTETPDGTIAPQRPDWTEVEAPEIVSVTDLNDGTMNVIVKAVIGGNGADKVVVTMCDENGKETSLTSSKEGEEVTFNFPASASGSYVFSAVAQRANEDDKVAQEKKTCSFVLPLGTPVVEYAVSAGDGKVEIKWSPVKEATGYVVNYLDLTTGEGKSVETTDLVTFISDLNIGNKVNFTVAALRNNEKSSESGATEVLVTEEAQRVWTFSRFGGSSINKANNGVEGSIADGMVTIFSENGKGKIVPGSTDQVTFYYTIMDAKSENFTITADVHVDKWTLSNGQEGFGLMVSDAVGIDGSQETFWNNSLQVLASKIEYKNPENDAKISMKLGLGYTVKTGVTSDDVNSFKNTGKFDGKDAPADFVSETGTLETSCMDKGAGTYNLVGNYEGTEPAGNVEEPVTDFKLQIQKNNTGYYLRYLDEQGEVISEKLVYDIDNELMTDIDEENIYVGFFASRNARITVSNVELITIAPADDEAALEREVELVEPVISIESGSVANSGDYEFVFVANADGKLTVANKDNNKTVAENIDVVAGKKVKFVTSIEPGRTEFAVEFTPNPDYKPGEFKALSSYETIKSNKTVEYKLFAEGREGYAIYVAPDGKADGLGTKDSPTDIYTAVKYVAPGQTIVLMDGTYNLKSTVKIERGINGTSDKIIYMVADTACRPVLDFGGNCAGMVVAGDYWYLAGFDVTRSANAQKGVQISGKHCVVDSVNAYKNGNTGIQISRYLGTDSFDEWPSDNLILNCTSYLNADAGYEDADGFAAKLTVGNNNVFDGCIAMYNADDGWDLFAKVETGSIGSVTIKNCVTYMNGYVLRLDEGKGELDLTGTLVEAGNGNGFKMGGESLAGGHELINSIAFANKAKGIDSNSCPDIKVFNSTSFDNNSYNVAFYTNTAVDTNFSASGIISYKKTNDKGESVKLKGTQDNKLVYGETNYYFDGTKSSNGDGNVCVADDWFESLEIEDAPSKITRNNDGTINMNGLLVLTDKAPLTSGARITGMESLEISKHVNSLNEITVVEEPSQEVTEQGEIETTSVTTEETQTDETETQSDEDDAETDADAAPNMILYIVIGAVVLVVIMIVVVVIVQSNKKKNSKKDMTNVTDTAETTQEKPEE